MGPHSHLLTVLAAAEQLRRRPDLRAMIAATVDEDLVDDELPEGQQPREGAAAWVLADAGPIELCGWALAGPNHAERAIEQARTSARTLDAALVRLDAASLASQTMIDIESRLDASPRVFHVTAASVGSCALVLRRAS